VAGSGLGLSIVQQIAARMAGRLRFERDADGHHARVSLDVRRTVDPRPIAPGHAA
jgi:signal transduction histidine kinase